MTRMLASVANLAEARYVLEAGADLIDLKNPAAGALGALPVEQVTDIVAALQGQRPLSATVGDLPMEPAQVAAAVKAMASTGVDYVKVGFFPAADWFPVIDALSPCAAQGIRLVAVLFGDCQPGISCVEALAEAGFHGVMLDTLDKRGGPLPQVCGLETLRDFVAEAKANGLLCGLAGSLRQADVPLLLNLHPDYLGFRGALCRHKERNAELDRDAVRSIRSLLPI